MASHSRGSDIGLCDTFPVLRRFYTLANLAALYMALDLGLSAVLVQFAAREFVGLSWGIEGKVEGAVPSRFLTLVRLSMFWYGAAAVVFLLAYPAGVIFLGNGHGDLGYDWHGPWALLVCATAAGFAFLPITFYACVDGLFA